jgi:hypothetical protein
VRRALEVRFAAWELHGLDAEGVTRVVFPVQLYLVSLKDVHLLRRKVAFARDSGMGQDNFSPHRTL